MQSTETVRRKIQSANDLLSVVKTMKGLAAVNVRHYERAVESLGEYSRTVEMGLHIVLSTQETTSVSSRRPHFNRIGGILFGSDQGFCGQFNQRIVDHAYTNLDVSDITPSNRHMLAIGGRVAALGEENGLSIGNVIATPGGITGISPLVQELLFHIERWRSSEEIEDIRIYHCQPQGTAGYIPRTIQLLPVDLEWLHKLEVSRWQSRVLPTFTMDKDQLFSSLIKQHMYIALFGACAESLAAENAARVASMQNVESNIEDRITELKQAYHRQRQNQIDAELLDIVSGYDAVINA